MPHVRGLLAQPVLGRRCRPSLHGAPRSSALPDDPARLREGFMESHALASTQPCGASRSCPSRSRAPGRCSRRSGYAARTGCPGTQPVPTVLVAEIPHRRCDLTNDQPPEVTHEILSGTFPPMPNRVIHVSSVVPAAARARLRDSPDWRTNLAPQPFMGGETQWSRHRPQ